MIFDYININWTAVSAIIALISLIFTWWQIYLLKKQRIEDTRARLNMSIIAWNGLFLLKITNVGRETAYDIKLQFNSKYIREHYSNHVKWALDHLQQRSFCIESHKSYFADLGFCYISSRSLVTYHAFKECREESFNADLVNSWLDTHKDDKIKITGTYCNNKYKIREDISLSDFIGMSVKVHDDVTSELKGINANLKILSKKVGNEVISELNGINNSIKKLSNNEQHTSLS